MIKLSKHQRTALAWGSVALVAVLLLRLLSPLLARFDLALPIGVFTGLAVFIPYLGFGTGLLLALLAGVLQFANLHGVLAIAVVFGIGQLLESFVLTPRFVGVLIAMPLSALAAVAIGRLHRADLASALFR